MKRMGTILKCVLAGSLILGLPSAAMATDARVEALAIPGFYIDDEEGANAFPTVYARTGNLVTAGLGTSGVTSQDNRFGIIASGNRDKYGVFSVQLRGSSPFIDALNSTFFGFGPNIDVPSQQYDLGWAKQFSSMALGLRFEHAASKFESGDDEAAPADDPGDDDWNTTALHAGVKFDQGDHDFIEIGGEFRMLSFKNTFVDPDFEDDAGTSLRGSARWWHMVNDKTDFVPAVSFTRVDVTMDGDEEDRTHTALHAGGSFIFDVNGDNTLWLGAAFNHQKDNFDDHSATWVPTLFGALEWDIKSWLTGRVGAQQAMRMESQGDDNDLTEADFSYGLGVGMHFNNFDIDCTLNERFPFSGGYLISGDSTSDMFMRVSGLYRFN